MKKKERFVLSGWMMEVRVERSSLEGGESCMHFEEMEFRCIDDYRRMFHIYIYGSLIEYFRKWFMDDTFLDDNLLYVR